MTRDIAALQKKAKDLRRDVLDMIYNAAPFQRWRS